MSKTYTSSDLAAAVHAFLHVTYKVSGLAMDEVRGMKEIRELMRVTAITSLAAETGCRSSFEEDEFFRIQESVCTDSILVMRDSLTSLVEAVIKDEPNKKEAGEAHLACLEVAVAKAISDIHEFCDSHGAEDIPTILH